MNGPIKVGYTVEQCWHDTPGGTAVAALNIATKLGERPDDVDLRYVAGKHARLPAAPFRPDAPVAMLPLARPWLYETWTRLNWPKVEAVTGEIDVAHATGLVPCATSAPLVVTVHDLAFMHLPEMFTKHGVRVMRRSLDVIRRRAAAVICSSRATIDDCVAHGFDVDRLRLVPLGVADRPATERDVDRVRGGLDLPAAFVLFVGTLEPRKNLTRLVDAMRIVNGGRVAASWQPRYRASPLPLVVVGADGWGDVEIAGDVDVRFLGFRSDEELRSLYAAATLFAYPSQREGFGLPVLEAMVQGTPVVTSRGSSTEEVAGGAAVLVDPLDVDDIARGVIDALDDAARLAAAGRDRARQMTWSHAAERTLAVYRDVVDGGRR